MGGNQRVRRDVGDTREVLIYWLNMLHSNTMRVPL